jgi:thiol-disulfide isomerase/thioredoxin
MKKIFSLLLTIMFCAPVFAGQYEDALRTGKPVVLYMYTKTCKYCKQFKPVFERIAQNNKNTYRFVSIDAESPYGRLLMRDLYASYVPFVVLSDAKRQYFVPIAPSCAIEYSCIEKEMKNFLK